jgi:4-amino-4-deoxy-L-arabinose transferase-like glycosyltransferase
MAGIRSKELRAAHSWSEWLDKWFNMLLITGILVNASGLFLPVLEPDGALYATLSKNMVLSGDFIRLHLDGNDWLDKPHFPFWITALSFKILGMTAFAYKFPAFLFWLAGAGYTYAFAKKLRGRDLARLGVLIYLAAEHLIISNNDVRAEPYLCGLLIAAVYHYYLADRGNRLIHFFLGSFLLAMAVMTKGIFVILLVASGFLTEWIFKRKWDTFLNYRWWLALLALIVFILPELISLYIQFDLHPEKIVFGRTGVSGLRFFFWDSQMGRFLNTGPIRGKGDPLFYVHTVLWAFLPWSLILVAVLAAAFKKPRSSADYPGKLICAGIGVAGFLLFSFSRFQLPHYLNILYPFFSIIVAGWLIHDTGDSLQKITPGVQNTLCLLLIAALVVLFFIFDPDRVYPILAVFGCLVVLSGILFSRKGLPDAIGRSFCIVLLINLFLNMFFYPVLFQYESGRSAALFLKKNNSRQTPCLFEDARQDFAFDFYSEIPVKRIKGSVLDTLADSLLILGAESKTDSLKRAGSRLRILARFAHFPISRLTGTFINNRTRKNAIDYQVLAEIYGVGKVPLKNPVP